jgi:hypothetical protein
LILRYLSGFEHGGNSRKQGLENEENGEDTDSTTDHPEHKHGHENLHF